MTDISKIVALCKRRGFVFPGSEIYGGLSNTWDFGPLGLMLKKNIKNLWWREFVEKEDNVYGIDGGIILSPKVWEASGHVENFTDPLVECKTCHKRFRVDQISDFVNKGDYYEIAKWPIECPAGDHDLSLDLYKVLPNGLKEVKPTKFNGMFRTFVGATEDKSSVAYLRPETAQAIFINFKNIIDSFHPKLPFGIAQVGKAFRNEITAGNFIFRDIEFEQMELEYFINPDDWENEYEFLLNKMRNWTKLIGLEQTKISEREHAPEERSHYSKKTVDLEFEYPFGVKELYGLAYRTDFDLKNHAQKSGADLTYLDEDGQRITPHVIEPSFGVERSMLAILVSSYREDEKRTVLAFPPYLAPYKAAVFPLLANKPDLVEKARGVYKELKAQGFEVAWDDRGNIGKRYLSQDEIGTPYCITVDFQTLEAGDDTVTIRDRDSMEQERVKVESLPEQLRKRTSKFA